MKKIEVLGTGCYKCIQLETLLHEILGELGHTEIEVERITDEHYIRKFMPVEEIPGLVIDGRLVCNNTVPSKEELRSWLFAS
ncbi:MAG: thioredoxin family protein [Chloroflexi bacterium]|nr:thioredoxin family protein [Chloroflexota bacterium]